MQTERNIPNNQQNINISNISNVNEIISRFLTLYKIAGSEILDDVHLGVIFKGIQTLDQTQLSVISLKLKPILEKEMPGITRNEIETRIAHFLNIERDWKGYHYIGESEGKTYAYTGKKQIAIANFIMTPKYQVNVENGPLIHVYDLQVVGSEKKYEVQLTAEHLSDAKKLQAAIGEQTKGVSASVAGCAPFLPSLVHKYINLPTVKNQWKYTKRGTQLLGLERLEDDGPKYFCAPQAVYDIHGNISDDIVFVGNTELEDIRKEMQKFSNLEHDPEKWKTQIAPEFLANVIRINEKNTMMKIVGWMGAIPHDYVIRKVARIGGFPHLQLVGKVGSGKSTIMGTLKQFMGHGSSSVGIFSTPFALRTQFSTSYTIPIVLDEYGKRWSEERIIAVDAILVEAFGKAEWERGTDRLAKKYFKMKNPIMFGGQIPVQDVAAAERTVIATVQKSFHHTLEGKKAQKHLEHLQKMPDKNFWVGYCLWAARHTNEEVHTKFLEYYIQYNEKLKDERISKVYAVVALGLYYMKKLADELGADIGYTEKEIMDLINNDDGDGKTDLLEEFLQDIASYAASHGNNGRYGYYFGKQKAVYIREKLDTVPENPSKYGKNGKESCVYGQKLLGVKIKEVCQMLKSVGKNYDHDEIQTVVNDEFARSEQDPKNPENLVLAPYGCRIQGLGRYTIFNWDIVAKMVPEIENIEALCTPELKSVNVSSK